MKKIILIGLLVGLVFLSGCKYTCKDVEACEKYFLEVTDEPCLNEVIIHTPKDVNSEIMIPFEFDSDELCYANPSEPMEIERMINELIEEYPDNVLVYNRWKKDGNVGIKKIESNVTEITQEKVYEGNKIFKKCVKTKKVQVCRWER